jgi:hypothetical protein
MTLSLEWPPDERFECATFLVITWPGNVTSEEALALLADFPPAQMENLVPDESTGVACN